MDTAARLYQAFLCGAIKKQGTFIPYPAHWKIIRVLMNRVQAKCRYLQSTPLHSRVSNRDNFILAQARYLICSSFYAGYNARCSVMLMLNSLLVKYVSKVE